MYFSLTLLFIVLKVSASFNNATSNSTGAQLSPSSSSSSTLASSSLSDSVKQAISQASTLTSSTNGAGIGLYILNGLGETPKSDTPSPSASQVSTTSSGVSPRISSSASTSSGPSTGLYGNTSTFHGTAQLSTRVSSSAGDLRNGTTTQTTADTNIISNLTSYSTGYHGGHPGNYSYSSITNTSAPANVSTITGSGSAYAHSCDSASSDYESSTLAWLYGPPSTVTSTRVFDSTLELGPVITFCGTAVYANGNVTGTTVRYDTVTYEIATYNYMAPTPTGTFTGRDPACAIGKSDCEDLMRSWASHETSILKDTGGHMTAMDYPNCNLAPFDCDTCTIVGADVKVIYFPVPTTVSRDMCAEDPSNYVPPPVTIAPGKRSGVIDGTQTYYADKAYVSFNAIGAVEYCPDRGVGSTQIGQVRSGDIVEFESSELFTLREPNYGTQYPFNFADLNEPVPRSAYMGISFCFYQQCATVGQFEYNPILAVPAKLRGLDPLWANCALDFGGVFDPPYALTSASLLTNAPKTDTPAKTTDNGGTTPLAVNTGPMAQPGSTPTDSPAPGQRPTAQSTPTSVDPLTTPVETGVVNQNTDPIASAIMAGLGATRSQMDNPQSTQQDPPPPHVATIGTEIVQPISSQPGAVQVGSSVFKVGESGVVGGTPFVVGTSNIIIGTGVNAITAALPGDPGSLGQVLTAGGQAVSSNPTGPGIVVGDSTLTVGGSPATVSGAVFSVGPSGLVVATPGGNLQTFALPSAGSVLTVNGGQTGNPAVPTPRPDIFAPLGTATVNVVTNGPGAPRVVIGSQTLSVGGSAMTVSGVVYSVGANGLVISTIGKSDFTSTYAFSSLPGPASGGIVLTVGGHIIIATPVLGSPSASTIVISGTTLTIGGAAATIDGTVVSLGPSGLIIGGTKTVPVVSTTSDTSNTNTTSSTRSQTSKNTIVSLSVSTGSGTTSATSVKKGESATGGPGRLSVYLSLFGAVMFGLWMATG